MRGSSLWLQAAESEQMRNSTKEATIVRSRYEDDQMGSSCEGWHLFDVDPTRCSDAADQSEEPKRKT